MNRSRVLGLGVVIVLLSSTVLVAALAFTDDRDGTTQPHQRDQAERATAPGEALSNASSAQRGALVELIEHRMPAGTNTTDTVDAPRPTTEPPTEESPPAAPTDTDTPALTDRPVSGNETDETETDETETDETETDETDTEEASDGVDK